MNIKNKNPADYRKLRLSGKVLLKHYNSEAPKLGDVRLYSNNEEKFAYGADLEDPSYSGYIKAEIYDGKFWQKLDMEEFFFEREYKYPKGQQPIYTANLCKEVFEQNAGECVYRTYRGHFTRDEYIKEERITKSRMNRK